MKKNSLTDQHNLLIPGIGSEAYITKFLGIILHKTIESSPEFTITLKLPLPLFGDNNSKLLS